jgi:hypothetical protein
MGTPCIKERLKGADKGTEGLIEDGMKKTFIRGTEMDQRRKLKDGEDLTLDEGKTCPLVNNLV